MSLGAGPEGEKTLVGEAGKYQSWRDLKDVWLVGVMGVCDVGALSDSFCSDGGEEAVVDDAAAAAVEAEDETLDAAVLVAGV